MAHFLQLLDNRFIYTTDILTTVFYTSKIMAVRLLIAAQKNPHTMDVHPLMHGAVANATEGIILAYTGVPQVRQ